MLTCFLATTRSTISGRILPQNAIYAHPLTAVRHPQPPRRRRAGLATVPDVLTSPSLRGLTALLPPTTLKVHQRRGLDSCDRGDLLTYVPRRDEPSWRPCALFAAHRAPFPRSSGLALSYGSALVLSTQLKAISEGALVLEGRRPRRHAHRNSGRPQQCVLQLGTRSRAPPDPSTGHFSRTRHREGHDGGLLVCRRTTRTVPQPPNLLQARRLPVLIDARIRNTGSAVHFCVSPRRQSRSHSQRARDGLEQRRRRRRGQGAHG